MVHYMKLHDRPFEMIRSGKKDIELRLYDEKRRLIQVGDTIVFSRSRTPEQTLTATVAAIHRFPSFTALYETLPLERCGYLSEELETACAADMDAYYTPEQQAAYGVVGIEIQL